MMIIKKVKSKIRIVVLTVLVVPILFVPIFNDFSRPKLSDIVIYENKSDLGIRDETVTCKFPIIHPLDESILSYLRVVYPISCSSHQGVLTYIDKNGMIRFNKTELIKNNYAGNIDINCTYRDLIRASNNDFRYSYGVENKLIGLDKPNSDFVKVECKTSFGKLVYENYHAHVQKDNTVRKFKNSEELGVAVIGFDSISRLNFMRQFFKSYKYLTSELNATVLYGFNKIGENTYPNCMAMLTGSPPLRKKFNHFKNWPFIWEAFNETGAATMYAEDSPSINMFNYVGDGISKQPTRHYMRPFWIAVGDSLLRKQSYNYCLGSTPNHKLHFHYIKSFLNTYRDSPVFLFSLYNDLTHDDVNLPGTLDEDLLELLKYSDEENLFNQTVVFILGDHGNRIDEIRSTKVGQVEDWMPLVSIILPKWIDKVYPQWRPALNKNKYRLSSTYDIYETFLEILSTLGGKERPRVPDHFKIKGPGISLFKQIPGNRSCKTAGIPDAYCTCDIRDKNLSMDDPRTISAANAVVNHINKNILGDLKKYCSILALDTIQRSEIIYGEDRIRVRVVIYTKPGNGLFEALISVTSDSYDLKGDLVRINKYGNQAACLSDEIIKSNSILRSTCYCKS